LLPGAGGTGRAEPKCHSFAEATPRPFGGLPRRSSDGPPNASRRRQREEAVLEYLDEHGRIKSSEAQALLGIGPDAATRLFAGMRKRGFITFGSKNTHGRWAFYVRTE
jgi:hypothetical protein